MLSLSTETRRGCRLWNSSSPLGPGPSCTQSRPSMAAARACSSPFPAGMLFSQPCTKVSTWPVQVTHVPWVQPFLRHFSKASASVRLRSIKKSGSRRDARARRKLSRAPCRVLALGDKVEGFCEPAQPGSHLTWVEQGHGRGDWLASGVPLVCEAVHILLQFLLKVLLLALLIHGIPPCKASWSALPLALAHGAPTESLPNSHPVSPRLSSAAVLRRLGQSLVVLRASLAASSSLEPESTWVLLRVPEEGAMGNLACLH